MKIFICLIMSCILFCGYVQAAENKSNTNEPVQETEFSDSNNLFVGVKKEEKTLLVLHTKDLLEKVNESNYEEKRQQFVHVMTTTLMDEMPPLTFKMFEINNEAAIVCRLDESLMSRLDGGFSGDIAVKAFTQFGFPVLRFIIFWDFSDGTTQEMEHVLNIESVDVQNFFNACILSKKIYIHGILPEDNGGSVSKFVVTLISSQERNDAILAEIEKATTSYHHGTENDFETAVSKVRSKNLVK